MGFLLRVLQPGKPAPIPDPSRVARILVIRQHNQLGDMLCVVPLLRALRSTYRSAHISLMASPVNVEVMRNNRYIDSLINYDKKMFAKDGRIRPRAYLSFVAGLRRERFDIVLVPMTVSMSFTSCFLAFLSGGRTRIGAARIDGKENAAGAFFTIGVDLDWRNDPHRHQTLRNLDTARDLPIHATDLRSEIFLSEQELSQGEAIVRKEVGGRERAIAFHPGAGKVPNRWPADRFAATANELAASFNARIFVTKGPMDEGPVGELLRGLREPPAMVENRPIREVAAIMARMSLVISNDTGIMHVAAAVGIPVLSLFGPTDPLQWAPIGNEHAFLCAGSDIRSITIEEVVKNAKEMLREERQR